LATIVSLALRGCTPAAIRAETVVARRTLYRTLATDAGRDHDAPLPNGPRQRHRVPKALPLGDLRHVDQHAIADRIGAGVLVNQIGVLEHGMLLCVKRCA
jgi:hypothetical protein